jgi:hypothetical protein
LDDSRQQRENLQTQMIETLSKDAFSAAPATIPEILPSLLLTLLRLREESLLRGRREQIEETL